MIQALGLVKGWMTRQLWLIRISMSPNLPESNYSALGTVEVAFKPVLKMARLRPPKNVLKKAELNRLLI